MSILSLKNIHKSFGEKRIHQGVSFHLNKGETLGLLGNSGTGKSVLLRSIIGLEEIDQGEIYYYNNRIDQLFDEQWFQTRTKISYAFQSGALFDSENVYENLAYPLREHRKMNELEIANKIKEVLQIIDMPGTQNLMPADLSGGMQKRVGLARSIILDPEIILYDEPTAGLDPVNVERVLKIMNTFKEKGIAGIFVTHDIPAAIKVCDRILILNNGVIAIEDTPQNLLKSQDPLVRNFFQEIE